MPRAERRHQEERIKARWLRRLRSGWRLTTRQEQRRWAERFALRFAHHNKCDCDTCTGFHQRIRHRDIKRGRAEARHAERDDEGT